MERRVPDGFSQPRRTEHELQSAPSLAGELGWNANEVVNESMFSASVTGLSLSRLTLETRPSARASQHSPSPFANARPPSRGLRQRALWSGGAATRSSLDSNASSYQPSAMALINPSRRDIATGMAMPVEPPCFAPEEVVLGPADCVALDAETLPPGARSERLAALASPSMIRAWSAPAARGQPTAAEQHEVQTSLEVEQTLAELRRQRLGYEQAGRYMEADAVRRRAEDVAIADSARKRDALVVRQVSEQVAAEDAYALEHAILSNRWEAKMEHFERQAAAVADALARRHERELQDLSSSLANKPAARSRPSTAQSPSHKEGPSHKGERYAGKGSADPSKELETPLCAPQPPQTRVPSAERQPALRARRRPCTPPLTRWRARPVRRVARNRAQASRHLTARQRAEVAASEQRVLGSRRNHSHRRELDFANVQKRFANILAELATQQRAEQVRLERVEKLHTIRFELAASKAASGAPPRRLAKPREASDVIVTSTVRVQPSL
jgi:hypothetical protein